MNVPKSSEIKVSGIGGLKSLSSIWSLPSLPLTEQFGAYDPGFPTFHQELMVCQDSGHFQLKNCIDPDFLYQNETYNFFTVPSRKILEELNFLIKSLEINRELNESTRVLEIGGNNSEMANLLSKKVDHYVICDPIFRDFKSLKVNVSVWTNLIEDRIDEVLDYKPTVIIGRHVLEHVLNPFETLLKLVEKVPDGTLFCFETPSLVHILSKLRFDAVFHQHLHYFDEDSINFLVKKLNCELINIVTNPNGSNGGSILFSFKKSTKQSISINSRFLSLDAKVDYFRCQVDIHQKVMESQIEILDAWTGEKFGLGAGLMLSTYNYHLKGRIEMLNGILDDDESKNGLSYKNINVKVFQSDVLSETTSALVLVTSLENQLAIRKRIGMSKNWISLGLPIF